MINATPNYGTKIIEILEMGIWSGEMMSFN